MIDEKKNDRDLSKDETDTVEREILAQPKKKKWWRWMTSFGGLFVIFKATKIWAILNAVFIFFKLSKFLATGLSMLLMIVTYTFIYGWQYAIGIVALLFIHEMGHLLTSRRLGLDTSLPLFIPFVGALIQMKEQPQDAKIESIVAIGGPILGAVGAFLCLFIGELFYSGLFLAMAYFGFILTVFNLIPAHPLDGGRIVTAISLKLWAIGIPVMLGFSLYFFNPIGILISLLAISKAWEVWKDRDNPYYDTDTTFRILMGVTYFTLFVVAAYYSYALHETLAMLH
jgi:Zn-dependent protease